MHFQGNYSVSIVFASRLKKESIQISIGASFFPFSVDFFSKTWFVCVEVLRTSQPSGVMWSTVSLPNHTFTGQA